MEEWKELNINDLPQKFFTRNDIEIEVLFQCEDWRGINPTFKNRLMCIEGVKEDHNNYRYRLKPLENIRITKQIYFDLLDKYQDPSNNKFDRLPQILGGRKIEIID